MMLLRDVRGLLLSKLLRLHVTLLRNVMLVLVVNLLLLVVETANVGHMVSLLLDLSKLGSTGVVALCLNGGRIHDDESGCAPVAARLDINDLRLLLLMN